MSKIEQKQLYPQWKESGEGLVVGGIPIEQLSKLDLIKTVVSLNKRNINLERRVETERATGISLLKEFAQQATNN